MTENEKKKLNFAKYVDRMKEIRLLSSPDTGDISDPEDYSWVLTQNFCRIGELAVENRRLVDDYLKPILSSKEKLSGEIRAQLERFTELLVEDASLSEVDAHLSEVINDLLLSEDLSQVEGVDDDALVILMARKVKRDYLMLAGLTRYDNDETEAIRKKAIENSERLADYLDKDVFPKLGDEAKASALQYSLMSALLYENNLHRMPEEYWERCIRIVDMADEILGDPFYREAFPDYDWDTYEFRIYYYGSFLAYSVLPEKIALKAYDYAQKAISFLETCTNEDILAAVDVEQERELLLLASVQAGITSPRKACETFYEAYEKRDPQDFSLTGVDKNLDTPSLYLGVSKLMQLELNEEDHDRYYGIQKSVLDYLYHVPNHSDKYMKCVTLFCNLPRYFREVPNAMTMEVFCLNAFAAIHPPTYIHVNMVARFAECMARHIIRLNPELFIGFPGCDDADAVRASRDRIVSYTYHAGLCHDLGKLFIIDTISMYGRNLLDDEYSIIRYHPRTGAEIAMEHYSTRDYVDVIRGHHIWYDGSKGYPEDFDTSSSPYKTVIDLVLAADCLDAATDSVGRSYSKGKSFAEYEQEIKDGAGTHYAPYLPGLFRDCDARADLGYLLSTGRKKLYRETYRLLSRNETL